MITIPHSDEMLAIARRVVWFKEPADALAQTVHFLAYLLTYGVHEDVRAVRRHVDDRQLIKALDQAPPGVIDPRSWTYWNLMLGRHPASKLPTRHL